MNAAPPSDGQLEPPMLVLVVEDNADDAELLAVRLASQTGPSGAVPVQLLQAGTVAGACGVLKEVKVDVIILDLTLPDAHLLEALQCVRAEAPDVPVVVLTGTADEALALEALRAGAQDYILKPPPDGRALRRVLRYARERQQLRKELDAALRSSRTTARHWRVLAEVAGVLAAPDLRASAIVDLGRLIVPEVAECFVLFIPGDEELSTVADVAHTDEARGDDIRRRLQRLVAESSGATSPLLDVVRATERASGTEAMELPEPVAELCGMASGILVHVRIGGTVRGFAALGARAERDAAVDAEFARLLADLLSLALERSRLLRQLQRAVAARDRTLGIVSHDLRNPLHVIEICGKAILDPEPQPPGGIRRVAEIIQRSAAWMQQIVQDLVDRASLDAGRLALNRQPTVVSEVIAAARIMLAPVAEEEGLEFVVTCAPDLPLVDADSDRLLQILSNLLSNAMKFAPAGQRVELSAVNAGEEDLDNAAATSGAVRFTVSDTGPGIPAAELDHVFDWFWKTRRGNSSGGGLGLAIAHGLVEAHGGHLRVESAPGQGCTFWFAVPAIRGPAQQSQ